MDRRTRVTTTSPVTVTSTSPQSTSRAVTESSHTFTTVKETTRTTKHDRKGNARTVSKTKTVYYVDGKPVKLSWFDRLRLAFMGRYERQAFLAEKLLEQEKKDKKPVGANKKKNKTRVTTTVRS